MHDHEHEDPRFDPEGRPLQPDIEPHGWTSGTMLPEASPPASAASEPPIPFSDTPSAGARVSEPWPAPASSTDAGAVTATTAAGAEQFAALRREIGAWFKTLFSAAIYATLIVTFGVQVARVEGQSMAPTLADQDRLIVNKLAYHLGPPRKGDIVMLYYPHDPDKSFVKRVIAEEGDTVKIEDGRVFVNNVPMRDDYVLPEYRSHEDQPTRFIQSGYYFVMGDHRNNSSDSRTWGEVPKKYIVGRVQLRWWPIPHARLF
jgi:signal peptidase I